MQSVEKIPINRIKLQKAAANDNGSFDHIGPVKPLVVKSKVIIEKKVSPVK